MIPQAGGGPHGLAGYQLGLGHRALGLQAQALGRHALDILLLARQVSVEGGAPVSVELEGSQLGAQRP